MSKLIVSVFTERYNYPFLFLELLHIAIILYQKQQNRKLYKTLVFKPRGLFTSKCRSPPFLFSKPKQRT